MKCVVPKGVSVCMANACRPERTAHTCGIIKRTHNRLLLLMLRRTAPESHGHHGCISTIVVLHADVCHGQDDVREGEAQYVQAVNAQVEDREVC